MPSGPATQNASDMKVSGMSQSKGDTDRSNNRSNPSKQSLPNLLGQNSKTAMVHMDTKTLSHKNSSKEQVDSTIIQGDGSTQLGTIQQPLNTIQGETIQNMGPETLDTNKMTPDMIAKAHQEII